MKSVRNFAIALLTLGITTLASAQSETEAPNESKKAAPETIQTEVKEVPAVEKQAPVQKEENVQENVTEKALARKEKQAKRKEKAREEEKQ